MALQDSKKKNLFAIMAVMLLCVLTLSMVACTDNKSKIAQKGIIIEETEKEEFNSNGELEKHLLTLLKETVDVDSLDENIAGKVNGFIGGLVSEIDGNMATYGISNEDYESLAEDIKDNKDVYKEAIRALLNSNGKEEHKKAITDFLLMLCSYLKREGLSNMIYDTVGYAFNYRYTDWINDKDVTAKEEARKDSEDFQKIERKDFEKFVIAALLLYDLTGTEAEIATDSQFTLSDEEIAVLLKMPDLSINIDKTGWTLILKLPSIVDSLLSVTETGTKSYSDLLYDRAVAGGDLEKIAEKMVELCAFVPTLQSKITGSLVKALSNTESDAYDIFITLLPNFTEEDWNVIDSLLKVELKGDYGKAVRDYNKDKVSKYENYKTEMQNSSYTLDDLKNFNAKYGELTKEEQRETFNKITESIIAKINPAFCFGRYIDD